MRKLARSIGSAGQVTEADWCAEAMVGHVCGIRVKLSPVGGSARFGTWLDHLIDLRGQRRTAYGGESNCLIETKARDASKWCIPRADFCPVLRMSMGRDSLKRG